MRIGWALLWGQQQAEPAEPQEPPRKVHATEPLPEARPEEEHEEEQPPAAAPTFSGGGPLCAVAREPDGAYAPVALHVNGDRSLLALRDLAAAELGGGRVALHWLPGDRFVKWSGAAGGRALIMGYRDGAFVDVTAEDHIPEEADDEDAVVENGDAQRRAAARKPRATKRRR